MPFNAIAYIACPAEWNPARAADAVYLGEHVARDGTLCLVQARHIVAQDYATRDLDENGFTGAIRPR